MPSIHIGSGGEAAAKKGIRAGTIATRTIRNDRTTEGPGLDRCRCKSGTDECKGNRSPPQVGSAQSQLANATLAGALSSRQVNRNGTVRAATPQAALNDSTYLQNTRVIESCWGHHFDFAPSEPVGELILGRRR
jgi:hypothetical protein